MKFERTRDLERIGRRGAPDSWNMGAIVALS
jgi:hypothetical protein